MAKTTASPAGEELLGERTFSRAPTWCGDHQVPEEVRVSVSYCDSHGDGFGGRTTSLYVTMVHGPDRDKRRLRMCGRCLSDVRQTFGRQWSDGFVLTKFENNTVCASCETPREPHETFSALYATGYSERQQRFDYYAVYCPACAASVKSHFALERNGNHAE